MPQQQKQGEDVFDVLIIPIAMVIFIVGIYLVYDSNRYLINSGFIFSAEILLYPTSFFIEESRLALIQLRALNPSQVQFDDIFTILNYSGRIYAFLLLPIAFYLAYTINKEELHTNFTRKFDIMSLVRNNADVLPFLKPIANREKSILEEDANTGGWATPRQPIHWIAHNQLLIDKDGKPFPIKFMLDKNQMAQTDPLKTPLLSQSKMSREMLGAHLDKKRTTKLLIEQLGDRLETDKSKIADSLKDYEAGIVAALLGYGSGNKELGYEYISLMGESFKEGEWDEKTKTASNYELDIGDAREYITKCLTDDDLDESLLLTFSLHGTYKYCWFMSLIENYAAEKGVFCSSLYIFLRPTDNRLFLTLNQVGGNTGWIESFGIWSHYEVEKTAGYTISEHDLSMELAIKNIETQLVEAGWTGNNPEVYK